MCWAVSSCQLDKIRFFFFQFVCDGLDWAKCFTSARSTGQRTESPCGQHMESSLQEAQDGFEPLVVLPGGEREKAYNIILSFSALYFPRGHMMNLELRAPSLSENSEQ